jgi:molybdopterin molybdotransferase
MRYQAALRLAPRGVESVRLEDALGRVLAADITATTDLPPFQRSLVDGWAVRAADVSTASPQRPVRLRRAGDVRMGESAPPLQEAGSAVRIPTGGMLPLGADAVVMQEHADEDGGDVLVRTPARVGAHVIARGADVRAGEVVLRRGRRLRPPDLGILAGEGIASVPVYQPPRVAIFATGDEIVPPHAALGPGQVRDMNSVALAAAVSEAGGIPVLLGIVRDAREEVDAVLRRAIVGHEMVLVSGGSSVGERDVVADAIGALGPPGIVVHGVAVRPGRPTVLAAVGSVPVIGLPGNPVSALVIFHLFARPVLDALAGADSLSGPWRLVRAKLADPLAGPADREDHRRVRLEARSGRIWAMPLPVGSQVLTSLVHAHGIVVVPPGRRLRRGAEIDVHLLG